MADVKWIKIVTNVFDNRKIKLIRKMPEGAELVITWFQLLCLAGEINDNGLVYITKAVPYTEETLATAFDIPLSTIRLALDTFQQLEMITIYNSFLCVSNWEKYQNVDKLEKIKEQTRVRVANYKQRQKQIASGNVTVTLPVTQGNATEQEQEEDINTILSDLQSDECVSIEDVFNKTYSIYPRKQGKAKGKQLYMDYLKGRTITGQGKIKFNHQQIYIAVQAYANEMQGRDTKYIKLFDVFMHLPVIDYVEKTKQPYEEIMQEKYGDEWKDVKFKYST